MNISWQHKMQSHLYWCRMLEEMFEDSDMWLTSESPAVRQVGL
ncbi:hypothetical protein [Enterobacter hormaechei]|nr:hypothetical protein [Enterobacter hormaechei]